MGFPLFCGSVALSLRVKIEARVFLVDFFFPVNSPIEGSLNCYETPSKKGHSALELSWTVLRNQNPTRNSPRHHQIQDLLLLIQLSILLLFGILAAKQRSRQAPHDWLGHWGT